MAGSLLRLGCRLAALALCLIAGQARAADTDGDVYFDEATPTPAAMLALQDCDAGAKIAAHRKPFAGGFVFAIQCPSNNENFMETLIFSAAEDGANGWPLKFPGPPMRKGAAGDVLSNIRWYPKTREICEIFVDRESLAVCRSEGRWKLEGEKRTPKLVFWRETSDCDGRRGWVVVVGKR